MDQSLPTPARFPRSLLTAMIAFSLLPGCAWMKGQTASKVVADPERKQIADSTPGKKVAAPDKSNLAKADGVTSDGEKSAAVRLDGSAAANGAPATPNAPSLAGARALAGSAYDDPAMGLPDSLDEKDADNTAASRTSNKKIVVTSSGASPGNSERKIVTADDRGDDDRGDAADETPSISNANESLANEKSDLEFEGAGIKIKNGQVAATVNGQPIFAEDVLRQLPVEMANHLAMAEREAPPEKYRAMRQHLVKVNLPQHVERELLLQGLKTKIKEDQLKTIQKQIDATYNSEYLPLAMKHAGVKTEGELEEALRKQGSSIEVLRSQFRARELGQQYLGAKALPKTGFDRPDVLKYYQEHKEDYAVRAQAKWEQIRLSYSKNGGKNGARKKAEEIIERLENGEEFAAIARECSDGPTAATKGGLRGWTTEGTLKDKEIEQALYEQTVGEIGPPIDTEDSIEIVRVIERRPSGYQPFPAVQEDIKAQLKATLWQKAVKALIKDLKEKATIETFIDQL